jgi:hypothetical protein
MGFFPIDDESLNYLRATGRTNAEVVAFGNYFKAQKMFGIPRQGEVDYSVELELDLATITPAVAGPKRPQDRIELPQLKDEFRKLLQKPRVRKAFAEFEGNALTRPPKGFPCEHPAMDLIRCRQWGLSTTLPATAALEPDFAKVLIRHFKLAAPVVDALNTPLKAALDTRKKVLFGLR